MPQELLDRPDVVAVLEQMGREGVPQRVACGGLGSFFERYRDAGPPYPTSLDLYAELRAVTPDSLHGLLEDLFETITLWDVRAERATVEPTGTGE